MTMQEAVRSVFQNYATFAGRARRAEYWWFILFSFIVTIVLGVLDGALFGYSFTSTTSEGSAALDYTSPGILPAIWSLASFIPALAVAARRLHDIGRSGWWLLIGLVPLIGAIVLIVWFATKSDANANAHGPNPVGPAG